jgi:hypothetical protein
MPAKKRERRMLIISISSGIERWLAGASSPKGIDPTVLSVLEHHLDEFGQEYARAFVAAVPEPTSGVVGALLLLAQLPERRRRSNRA